MDPAILERIVDRAGAGHWIHPVEILEPREDDPKAADYGQLVEKLVPILAFLGRAKKPRDSCARTWVLLSEAAPHFVNGESMAAAAKRIGLSPARIAALVREFREALPGHFRGPHQKAAATVQAMRRAHRARLARRRPDSDGN